MRQTWLYKKKSPGLMNVGEVIWGQSNTPWLTPCARGSGTFGHFRVLSGSKPLVGGAGARGFRPTLPESMSSRHWPCTLCRPNYETQGHATFFTTQRAGMICVLSGPKGMLSSNRQFRRKVRKVPPAVTVNYAGRAKNIHFGSFGTSGRQSQRHAAFSKTLRTGMFSSRT